MKTVLSIMASTYTIFFLLGMMFASLIILLMAQFLK